MSKQHEPVDPNTLLTIPNVLTIIRVLLIPLYWKLMADGNMYAALAVYVAASLTDLLDGYLARRLNQITNFGKLVDPLADKIMVMSVMLSMMLPMGGREPILPSEPFFIILGKELLMVLGGLILFRNKLVVYSKAIGKAAQLVMVLSLLCSFFYKFFRDIGFELHIYLLWLAVILHICAIIFYAHHFLGEYKKQKQSDVQSAK